MSSTAGEFLHRQVAYAKYAAKELALGYVLDGALPEDFDTTPLLPDWYDTFYVPRSFDEAAHTTHKTMQLAVEDKLRSLDLPTEMQIPGIDAYADDFMEVHPAYERMVEAGLQPEIVLYPTFTSMSTWDKALQNYGLDYHIIEGAHSLIVNKSYRVQNSSFNRSVDRSVSQPISWGGRLLRGEATLDIAEGTYLPERDWGKDWEVAVVNATNGPAFTNVSPTARIKRENRAGIEAVRHMVQTPDELTEQQVIGVASPHMDVYLALQWLRIARGLPPVDIGTNTLLRESFKQDGAQLCGGWSVSGASVYLPVIAAENTHPDVGMRPTVYASSSKTGLISD